MYSAAFAGITSYLPIKTPANCKQQRSTTSTLCALWSYATTTTSTTTSTTNACCSSIIAIIYIQRQAHTHVQDLP
jgi:hypothetical protein